MVVGGEIGVQDLDIRIGGRSRGRSPTYHDVGTPLFWICLLFQMMVDNYLISSHLILSHLI